MEGLLRGPNRLQSELEAERGGRQADRMDAKDRIEDKTI